MKKLLQLLADNRRAGARAPVRIEASADGEEATLYLYDAIVASEAEAQYWGGASAEALVPQIRTIEAKTLNLRINSPGGDVFAGQAIAAAVRDTGARVIAHVDGYAASAATVVANAADEIVIASGGMYMIHNAWTLAIGNANDLSAVVELLRKIDGTLAQAYAARSGKKLDEIAALMDAETWFTADEAVAVGLVDRIATSAKEGASARAWNLAAYDKSPNPEAALTFACDEHRQRQAQRLRVVTSI
jgi:ATP-dependent Clp protease protease subunit